MKEIKKISLEMASSYISEKGLLAWYRLTLKYMYIRLHEPHSK